MSSFPHGDRKAEGVLSVGVSEAFWGNLERPFHARCLPWDKLSVTQIGVSVGSDTKFAVIGP